MPEEFSKAAAESSLWWIVRIPRLLPTAAAHGFLEIPFFIFPSILLLIQNQFGLDDWLVGLIGAGPMLLSGIMAPLAGALCDKIRKTSVIVLALGLSAIGSAIIGILGDTLLVLVVGLSILGITISVYHPAGFAIISQAAARHRSKMFAIHGVGGALGAGLGPLSVGLLIARFNYSWRMIYLIWTFPLLSYALVYKLMMQSHESEPTAGMNLRKSHATQPAIKQTRSTSQENQVMTRGLFLVVLLVALLALGRGSLNFFLPAFLSESKGIPIASAAFIYSSVPLFGIFGQMVGGSAADKTSEKAIVEVLIVAQVVVILFIYFTQMGFVLLGAFCLFGAVTSALWPATASLTAQSSTEENRGAAYGIYMVPQSILGAIAPAIGGFLKGINYSWLFGVASILNLSGIVIIHLFSEKTAAIPLRQSPTQNMGKGRSTNL